MDFNHEEAYESSSNNMLADEYPSVVDQGAFQFGIGSSRPGQNDKYGNPVITIVNRSGIHEIGVRWCCCDELCLPLSHDHGTPHVIRQTTRIVT